MTKRTKKVAALDGVESLRKELRLVQKTMKSLDGALRKEQSEKVSQKRKIMVLHVAMSMKRLGTAMWHGVKPGLILPYVLLWKLVLHTGAYVKRLIVRPKVAQLAEVREEGSA